MTAQHEQNQGWTKKDQQQEPEPSRDATAVARELYRHYYPTRWSRVKAAVRARIHRYRVRHLRNGQRVLACVGSKAGEGIVVGRVQTLRGGFVSYVVQFPDANYPETMVVPTGCYSVPASHIAQILGPASRPEGRASSEETTNG